MSENTKVVTPNAVLSYPHIAKPQPKKKDTDKVKYSATLIFPEGTDLSALKAAELAAATEKWGAKAGDMLRTGKLRSQIRTDVEKKDYQNYGTHFINTRSDNQPGTVYLHAEPGTKKPARVPQEKITDVFYPGAIVRAHLSAFAYDTDGNKGVSFGLNHIQKIAEGARIDSRTAPEDAFEADLNAVPADLNDAIA